MEPINFSPYLRLIQKTGATKHPYGFSATDKLLSRIELNRSKHVLDVGCGAGHTSAYVAKNYDCLVTGVDVAQDAVDRAKALHEREPYFDRLSFVVSDILKLAFADGQFDVVLCESVLFFVHDKEAACKEMARVLKPGGYLALNEVIVADTSAKRKFQDYFLRPEFGGFLVTAEVLRQELDSQDWTIILQDEKPFDLFLQLKSDLKHLFSMRAILPLFEMAHQAWVSKEMREDLISVIRFSTQMPKGVMENLNSFLLLAQKKPPQ